MLPSVPNTSPQQPNPATVPPSVGLPPTVIVGDHATQTTEVKKTGCCKKLFLGVAIFIGSIFLLILIGIFAVPAILNATHKDIGPIDDKDLQPQFVTLPDADNAFFDLEGIDKLAVESCTVLPLGDLKQCSPQDIPNVLTQNQAVFAKWDAASQKAGFQDPYYSDPTTPAIYKAKEPHYYTGIQKVARLNIIRGLSQVQPASSAASLNTLYENLVIAQKYQNSRSGLVGHLVGVALKTIAYQGFQIVTPNLKLKAADSLAWAQKLDALPYDPQGMIEGFKQEYFLMAYNLDAIKTGKNIDQVNQNSDLSPVLLSQLKQNAPNSSFWYQPNKTKKLEADSWRAQIAATSVSCSQLKDLPMPDRSILNNPIALYYTENSIGLVLHTIGRTVFNGLADQGVCGMPAQLNLTKTLIALKAYQSEKGKLPATLDELVPNYLPAVPEDPYTNQPLKYSADKKVIYSVGKNKVDDGGQGSDTSGLDLIVKIPF